MINLNKVYSRGYYYPYYEDEESGKEVIYKDDEGKPINVIYLGSIGDDYDIMRVIKINDESKLVHYLTLSSIDGSLSTRW